MTKLKTPIQGPEESGPRELAPVEPLVLPRRIPSDCLVEILQRDLQAGERLVGPDGRWSIAAARTA